MFRKFEEIRGAEFLATGLHELSSARSRVGTVLALNLKVRQMQMLPAANHYEAA